MSPTRSTASSTITKACDRCRARKIKCVPVQDVGDATATSTTNNTTQCQGCYNLDVSCIRTYVGKRPGPLTAREKKRLQAGRQRTSTPPACTSTSQQQDPSSIPLLHPSTIHAGVPNINGPLHDEHDQDSTMVRQGQPLTDHSRSPPRHSPQTMHVSFSQDEPLPLDLLHDPLGTSLPIHTQQEPRSGIHSESQHQPRFTSPLRGRNGVGSQGEYSDEMLGGFMRVSNDVDDNGAEETGHFDSGCGLGDGLGPLYRPCRTDMETDRDRDMDRDRERMGIFQLDPCASHRIGVSDLPPSSHSPSHSHPYSHSHSKARLPQIETILRWHEITHFITMFIKYQHHLMPLVHKPTFANDVLVRRDREDDVFRALLLSLVSYTICQIPNMTETFSQQELEKISAWTHRSSREIIARYWKSPSLDLLVAVIAGHYYCKSSGQTALSRVILGEAVALSSVLNLDESQLVDTQDVQSRELRRRTFWHLFNIDKTEVACGETPLLENVDHLPPLPLEVDDDFITSQGSFPQPQSLSTCMTGFVVCCRLFQSLSECQFRHRNLRFLLTAGLDLESSLSWAQSKQAELTQTVKSLPIAWQPSRTAISTGTDVFGTQRANILITATMLELALVELKAALDVNKSYQDERAEIAQRGYQMLSGIPIGHLAGNGESMRSKVFYIMLDVMKSTSEVDTLRRDIQDWWTMYSNIQFVQVIPLDMTSRFPSRIASPVRSG